MLTDRPDLELAAVSDAVLDDLVTAATTRADADDVTPPVTPGPSWTSEREAWLRAFHIGCRPGLDGPAGEITWAVLVDGQVVGSVRLRRTLRPAVVEIGMWLVRDMRHRGVGSAALAAALRRAEELGVSEVHADTTARNEGAIRLLRRHHFTLVGGEGEAVRAVRVLRQES